MGTPSRKYVIGHPEWGESPESGFDCSGFVRFVLTEAGLHVPDYIGQDNARRPIRHANEFWDYYGVAVHHLLHRSGDIIVFSRSGTAPTHVGIVRDEESYIHAPGKDCTKVEVAGIDLRAIEAADDDPLAQYLVNPIGYKAPTLPLEHPSYRYHQQTI